MATDGPENPLDNERSQVNADGVQWYWGTADGRWSQAALCAPAHGAIQQSRLVAGDWTLPTAVWERLPDDAGWRVRFIWERANLPIAADGTVAFSLVVNERSVGRARRRGQLCLNPRVANLPSAAAYAYLRGDRQDPRHALTLRLPTHL